MLMSPLLLLVLIVSVVLVLNLAALARADGGAATATTTGTKEQLTTKLKSVLAATDATLAHITERWQVNKFPTFLKAAGITHTSWEVMKLKFVSKLLDSLQGKPSKFIVSFMGSSVTAGHDTAMNLTFPKLVGILMDKPLAAAGITIDSRNAAIGNNPCSPYDLCPRTFSGDDADVVHWEQSYNCFGSDSKSRSVLEQFIRQSSKIPSNPVVVFSTSDTPNWKEDACAGQHDSHYDLTSDEKQMVELLNSNNIFKIVSEMNKDHVHDWGAVSSLFKDYKTAGVQMWRHGQYDAVKCKGPYVKSWGCCSASWHPSVLGHELRAHHYSFFWLHIFRDAVQEVMKELDGKLSLADLEQKTTKHINSEHKYIPQVPIYESLFPETIQCYTSYEPKYSKNMDLSNIILPSATSKPSFTRAIFEDFIDPAIIKKAQSRGYLDRKWMYYGNSNNEALSFKIHMKTSGFVHICGPPGEWGNFPKTLKPFYKVATKIYLTSDKKLDDKEAFTLDISKAKLVSYKNQNEKDSQSICANLEQKVPAGDHILSMVSPEPGIDIVISYLILPQ